MKLIHQAGSWSYHGGMSSVTTRCGLQAWRTTTDDDVEHLVSMEGVPFVLGNYPTKPTCPICRDADLRLTSKVLAHDCMTRSVYTQEELDEMGYQPPAGAYLPEGRIGMYAPKDEDA